MPLPEHTYIRTDRQPTQNIMPPVSSTGWMEAQKTKPKPTQDVCIYHAAKQWYTIQHKKF